MELRIEVFVLYEQRTWNGFCDMMATWNCMFYSVYLSVCLTQRSGCNLSLEGILLVDLFWSASQVALVVKNLPASTGDIKDVGSIPELGRSPGEGNGNPLQYSSLENPMDRVAWQAMGSQRDRHHWGDLVHTPGVEIQIHEQHSYSCFVFFFFFFWFLKISSCSIGWTYVAPFGQCILWRLLWK